MWYLLFFVQMYLFNISGIKYSCQESVSNPSEQSHLRLSKKFGRLLGDTRFLCYLMAWNNCLQGCEAKKEIEIMFWFKPQMQAETKQYEKMVLKAEVDLAAWILSFVRLGNGSQRRYFPEVQRQHWHKDCLLIRVESVGCLCTSLSSSFPCPWPFSIVWHVSFQHSEEACRPKAE